MPEAATIDALELPVLGMTCASCVGRVERAIAAVPGVLPSCTLVPRMLPHRVLPPGRFPLCIFS